MSTPSLENRLNLSSLSPCKTVRIGASGKEERVVCTEGGHEVRAELVGEVTAHDITALFNALACLSALSHLAGLHLAFLIKTMGRWASNAFTLYLREHAEIMAPYIQASPAVNDAFARLAMPPIGSSSQSAVDDFAMHLLGLLGYDEPNRVLHQRLNIPFVVCGENVHAKPDICLLDQNDDYILVIHTSQHHRLYTPEPQLIADAIAAFYENTRLRHTFGLQNIQPKVFAGIALESRTFPIFYKIPITGALLKSVITAQFPPQQTVVHRLIVPPVPDASIRGSPEAGMKPLANRRVILQCLEAFKQFIQ
ncbi:hypothetical protein A0H81_13222 [Grifola frondosa]|uniref:Uncharacterized protein n=1 Tax=Grifola frondosa TaxID=5627 RepID=A0A1C7LV83_GRIFR|nr:hypothetical protein A0H81_13222 [Grifola frondosa]